MKKRTFALVLVFCLLLSLAPTAWATKATQPTWAGGSGTPAAPYQIATAEQLKAFRDSVNSGTNYAGQYIKLTAAIDLQGQEWAPIGSGTRSGSGYTTDSKPFKGTFDGDGNTISNLKITTTSDADAALGLFGVVDGGTVKNLTLNTVAISSTTSECAGGAIGLMVGNARAESITVAGAVTAKRGNGGIVGRMTIQGTITNCTNRATITATGPNVGGIVGAAYYTAAGKEMSITNCVNTGTVTGTGGVAGGIVGLSAANVTGCENSAAISNSTDGDSVGGIVGEQQNYGAVSGNTNSGEVVNSDSTAYGTGGIVGWVRYSGSAGSYPLKGVIGVINNTNSGSVRGGNDAGGIVGTVYNAAEVTGNENTAARLESGDFAAGIVGNIQFTETPTQGSSGGVIPQNTVNVQNNVSKTLLDNITGPNKGLYAYDNSQGKQKGKIIDNGTDWVAQIGDVKYATLPGAITAAKAVSGGATVELLENITVDVWTQIWDTENLTIDGKGKALTVGAVESGGNGDYLICGSKNLTVTDLTVSFETSGNCFAMASGKLENVTMNGGTNSDHGVFVSATDGEDDQVVIDGCTFRGFDKAIYSQPSNADSGKATAKTTVKDSVIEDCTYVMVSYAADTTFTGNTVTGCTKLTFAAKDNPANTGDAGYTVTGNIFDNTVRLKFYSANLNDVKFTGNQVLGTAYITTESAQAGTVLDASGNYWGGEAPSSQQLQGEEGTTKYDNYYRRPTMRPQDLNTYIPPAPPTPNQPTVDVETKPDGTVITTETRPDDVVVQTVDEPGKDVTATVTIPEAVGATTVTIPAKDLTPGTVAVDARTGKVVKLSVPTEDGVMVKLDGSAELILVDRSKDFDDVPGHWGEDEIDFAVAHGMFGGTAENTFSPDAPMTRAMLMTVLARFDDQDTEGGATWYEKSMEWAKDNGISDGTNPDGSITREQLATMLHRYAGSPAATGDLSRFTDAAKVSGYAADAVRWAVSTGVIAGMGDGTLAPQGMATRAQVAAVLARFCNGLVQ